MISTITTLRKKFFQPEPQPLQKHIPATSHTHFFFGDGESPIFEGKERPYHYYIEVGSYRDLHPLLQFIRTEQPMISLCLTTRTAFETPSCDMFENLLARHDLIAESQRDAIKTCLQESIMNAVIHGNLNIEHETELHDFQRYYDLVAQSLKNEVLASKRVSIHAWRRSNGLTIGVYDQGNGFDLSTIPEQSSSSHGRGIMLMKSLTSHLWQTQPNHVLMEFT